MTRSASHVSRALAAWREANPQGLIGRLVELHQRDPKRALVLARHIERHYGAIVEDVSHWPVVPDRSAAVCPSCSGSGRWGDDILCGRCNGEGALK